MLTETVYEDSRLACWRRVREFAVPPSMIESATARRSVGDWAGACAAAGFDVDFDLRSFARVRGRELAARIRADLRQLAPDLLRWHLPRIAPDGLLRPGLTVALARYDSPGPEDGAPVQLVARTAPAWADGGQRISLALWEGSRSASGPCPYPRPRPSRRFRLDLHRHLWDARRTGELWTRSGADRRPPGDGGPGADPALPAVLPPGLPWAVDRWAAEAEILLRAEGRTAGPVVVRFGNRQRMLLDPSAAGGRSMADSGAVPGGGSGDGSAPPVLPDAATWTLPDLELLRTGSIEPERLHPLVASALLPGHPVPAGPAREDGDGAGRPRPVQCRGALHRIGLVDGVLVALDHDPDELRREELLVALTGTPLPCLQAIDVAHRRPESLADIRARLDHGDTAGALAAVEQLLGPDALLRSGALRDELEAAVQQRITYGLFRAGLAGPAPRSVPSGRSRSQDHRSRTRRAAGR